MRPRSASAIDVSLLRVMITSTSDAVRRAACGRSTASGPLHGPSSGRASVRACHDRDHRGRDDDEQRARFGLCRLPNWCWRGGVPATVVVAAAARRNFRALRIVGQRARRGEAREHVAHKRDTSTSVPCACGALGSGTTRSPARTNAMPGVSSTSTPTTDSVKRSGAGRLTTPPSWAGRPR